MRTFVHLCSGAIVKGVQLPPGSVIRKDDRYDSIDGTWCTANSMAGGRVPTGNHVTWVRQCLLSDSARALLIHLNLMPWGENTCIGERNGDFYVIPSPIFNWDDQFGAQKERLVHSECVRELVGHGYLKFVQCDVLTWMSDHAIVRDGQKNCIYMLTDEGRREGSRLLAN